MIIEVIGYCGVCGVEIHQAVDSGTHLVQYGLISGKWYTCEVCGGRWLA